MLLEEGSFLGCARRENWVHWAPVALAFTAKIMQKEVQNTCDAGCLSGTVLSQLGRCVWCVNRLCIFFTCVHPGWAFPRGVSCRTRGVVVHVCACPQLLMQRIVCVRQSLTLQMVRVIAQQ